MIWPYQMYFPALHSATSTCSHVINLLPLKEIVLYLINYVIKALGFNLPHRDILVNSYKSEGISPAIGLQCGTLGNGWAAGENCKEPRASGNLMDTRTVNTDSHCVNI